MQPEHGARLGKHTCWTIDIFRQRPSPVAARLTATAEQSTSDSWESCEERVNSSRVVLGESAEESAAGLERGQASSRCAGLERL